MTDKEKRLTKDLFEGLHTGRFTHEEVKDLMKKRGLQPHITRWEATWGSLILVGLFLMNLPVLVEITRLSYIAFLNITLSIKFSYIVSLVAAVFIATGLFTTIYASHRLSLKSSFSRVRHALKLGG